MAMSTDLARPRLRHRPGLNGTPLALQGVLGDDCDGGRGTGECHAAAVAAEGGRTGPLATRAVVTQLS
jgi:hypothetical protein